MRPRPEGPKIRMAESGPSGLALPPVLGASSWGPPAPEPAVPPFNHLHPAVVHIPIALLAVAPLIFLIGGLWPAQRRGIHTVALFLLALGLLGGLLALATGDAAETFAHRTPELRAAVKDHEQAAQWTVSLFGLLTAAWLGQMGLARLRRRELAPGPARTLFILWLAVSALGVAALLRTGHLGGRMVHELHTHGGEP